MKSAAQVIILIFLFSIQSTAQFWNGIDSIYGNEWIQLDQSYFKIKIAENGIYNIDSATLANHGFPISNLEARHIQLWHHGQQVPLFSSTDGFLSADDQMLFFGKKNDGSFDTHLYIEGEDAQLNPDFSLFTDTSTYYVTWNASEIGMRMQTITNDTTNLPPAEPFYFEELKQVYNHRYVNYCEDVRCQVVFSHYDAGEGYGFQSSTNISNFIFQPLDVYTDGPNGKITSRLSNSVANTASEGSYAVFVNDEKIIEEQYDIQPALFQNEGEVAIDHIQYGMEVSVLGGASDNRFGIANLTLTYPRLFTFRAQSYREITIEASDEDKHIIANNFGGGPEIVVWNLTTQRIIRAPHEAGNNYRFRLPASDQPQKLILFAPSVAIKTIPQIESVDFTDFSKVDPNYIIITSQKFLDQGPDIEEYASYRASNEGGGFEPIVVPVEVLIDQFAYGTSNHPSSVRLFLQWAVKNWTKPEYTFIIGKGVVATKSRFARVEWNTIPTFGFPGSDPLLTSDNLLRPLMPSGRLPIIDVSEVGTYLNKVKTHEEQLNKPQSIADRAWAKNVIHLSGGDISLPGEILTIRNGLDNMKDVFEATTMAPEVHTFQKKTSGAVTVSDNQQLTNFINDGVSVVTYFGHSNIQLLDLQIIDHVNTLPPTDRYHLFIAMGCYAGDIFDSSLRSYSETWTLADQRGSIAFIANSSAGYIPSLQNLGTKLYGNFGTDYYGESIGLSVHDAILEFLEENRNPNNSLKFNIDVEIAFSLNLCGDPAMGFVQNPGPDYIIDGASVEIVQKNITTDTDSLNLKFNAVNIGQTSPDSLVIRVDQKLPSGMEETIWENRVPSPRYVDSFDIVIPNLGTLASGFNELNITIDALEDIAELPNPLAEQNNSLSLINRTYSFFVSAFDARPIYPMEYGIVGKSPVTLIASTSDVHVSPKSYKIQIDTTALFNSPSLVEHSSTQRGGTIEWAPQINWIDEQVYYWRISPDSSELGQWAWRNSSFVFISDHPEGWNQSHYFQFLESNFDSLELHSNRQWEFGKEYNSLKVRNPVVDPDDLLQPLIFKNNSTEWAYYFYSNKFDTTITLAVRNGVYVTIYEPTHLELIKNPTPPLYGSHNTSGGELEFFAYNTNIYDDRVALMDLLENQIEDGHFVVFTAIREKHNGFGLDLWNSDRDSTIGRSLLNILEEKGAKKINEWLASGQQPYSFVYQQGGNDIIPAEHISELNGKVELVVDIPTPISSGYGHVTSTPIGPALNWDHITWHADQVTLNDKVNINVLGIDSKGEASLLISGITTDTLDISNIDSEDYSQIRLNFEALDSIEFDPGQLNRWRTTFTGVADLAIDLNDDFYFYNDTLLKGEELVLRYAIRNVSAFDCDSFLIHYSIIDESNDEILVQKQQVPLGGLEGLSDEFNFNTKDLEGRYRLLVQLNPFNDFVEINTWNNIFQLPFVVLGDDRNPVLDVTFDSVRISNGDIVSAQPEIEISLRDNHPFLILDDTSSFNIAILYPEETEPREIYFSDVDVHFQAGSHQLNQATVKINRHFEMDGIYRLMVNAKDISDNISGDLNYDVKFRVIQQTSISNLQNHPNPFMDYTKFYYTLTGKDGPYHYNLQIVNSEGRLVREFSSDEIGPLKVGSHAMPFMYNGTDQAGNRLTRGVYFYKLTAEDEDGKSVINKPVDVDMFSRNGWGKLVIL